MKFSQEHEEIRRTMKKFIDAEINPRVDEWEAAEPDPFARQKSCAIRFNDEITVDVLPAAAGLPWEALREYVQDVMIDGIRV